MLDLSVVGKKAVVLHSIVVRSESVDVHLTAGAVGVILKARKTPAQYFLEFTDGETVVQCWLNQKAAKVYYV